MALQILHAWQPTELKKFKMEDGYFYKIGLVDIKFDDDVRITLENKDQILEIIYGKVNISHPLIGKVWNFCYGKADAFRFGLTDDKSKTVFPASLNKEFYYMYKVENSEFIKWQDSVSPFTSKDYPELEHHLFITDNDIIETLSVFEPRFIIKDK